LLAWALHGEGVALEVNGKRVGPELSLDLSGMEVALKK
jgi:hypothetical protein